MDSIIKFRNLTDELSSVPIYLKEITNKEGELILLLKHIHQYPQIRCNDIYKFILQGTCSWTHLLNEFAENKIKLYLKEELEGLEKPNQYDIFFELLDRETRLGRLNLRLWKEKKGNNIELLWKLMKKAQEETLNSIHLFSIRWKSLEKLVKDSVLFVPDEYSELLFSWIKHVHGIVKKVKNVSELPLVRHSNIYRKFYSPSYRIIREEDILDILNKI
ncbi:MAG: hypothetical protein ACTSSG_00870 [Candidatus Heimdallarchaeaceae archaeon]